jgi:hypothetical protein
MLTKRMAQTTHQLNMSYQMVKADSHQPRQKDMSPDLAHTQKPIAKNLTIDRPSIDLTKSMVSRDLVKSQ